MDKIRILQAFDLDETLFRMPGYTSKKCVENDSLKFETPYSFYDSPESLSEEAHNIQLIRPVYDAWKAGRESANTRSVLITHRIEELREKVTDILDKRGILFDEMFFLGRKTQKIDTLDSLVEQFRPDEIQIFEDSIEQISKYQEYFEKLNMFLDMKELPPIRTKIYIVDKSKVYRIENIKLSEEKSIKLI